MFFVKERRREGVKEGVSTRCTLRKRGGRSGFRKEEEEERDEKEKDNRRALTCSRRTERKKRKEKEKMTNE